MIEIVIQPQISIIQNYTFPYPRVGDQPLAYVVCKRLPNKEPMYLRYSRGPEQGHFWDVYPDDYMNENLARKAIGLSPKIEL